MQADAAQPQHPSVSLSECAAAVFHACAPRLMSVACPEPRCRVSVLVAAGIVDADVGSREHCPMAGGRVIDNRPTSTAADDSAHPTRATNRSPRSREPDVHLMISLRGTRFDFTVCLSAALVFVHEHETHRYADDGTVDLRDTSVSPRLPNERLYLQP